MNKSWLLILLMSTTAVAQQTPLTPDNFNYQTGITPGKGGPFQEVTLPYKVYTGVLRHNLDDVRVFNGQLENIPYALYKKQSTEVTRKQQQTVPVFPIITTTKQQDDLSLEIQRNSDGTIISLSQPGIRTHTQTLVRGVVIDTSNIKGHSRTLTLKTEKSDTPFHPFRLESSNDLQHWSLVKADNQLVQLRHGNRLIEKNTINWHRRHGSFLRLIWKSPQSAPRILAATVATKQTSVNRTQHTWSPSIKAKKITDNIFEYTLPGFVPVERMRFSLAQTNSLSPVELQYFIAGTSKHNPDRWQHLSNKVIYRLRTPQGDIHSDDILVYRNPGKRVRMVIDNRSGGIGNTPPTLQIGFIPHNLVFLPRGEGPYTLSWGNSKVKNASLSIRTLIPGFTSSQKNPVGMARLQAIDDKPRANITEQAEPEPDYSKGMLWIILVVGVLVLAGMAWMLVKQIKQGDNAGS